MPTLSSRPNTPQVTTQQMVLEAAQPSINLVSWLGRTLKFKNDHPTTIRAAANVIEEALECMVLVDYAVAPAPGPATHLVYEVAVQPLHVSALAYFKVSFLIQP
jgi:hypothetical protein